MSNASLSDKALAVFAFALYHQLSSGEPVSGVVTRDAAGHQADPGAVNELESAGLASPEADRIVFTEAGLNLLARLAEAMRGGIAQ
jgi:hypothetical protein